MAGRKNPAPGATGNGAEMVQALALLYGTKNTAPPRSIQPGSIVECDILPGSRLEVLEVHGTAATLRLANGARLRIGLHRLEVVA